MNCLILGAGLMQKPAILAAKELKYKAVVVDADSKAVCVPLADRFQQIDLKAKEEILEFAKQLQKEGGLKAVFTAGTDFSASVSYVAQALKLPSHTFEASLNASDKTRMRSCFAKENVPSPLFFRVSKDEIKDNISAKNLYNKVSEKISFPFVVKPVDNMGARACRMVRSEQEFYSAVNTATNSSRTGFAIVEEYMEGPEYSIDALIYENQFIVTGFALRHIKYPPYFIEIGHTMPCVLEKNVHDELISVFALGAKALGLSCGAAKADIKYTKNGPMIGEIAGRLSGGYMSGWTYPYSSDLNLTKQGLLIALGEEPEELLKNKISVDFVPSALCANAKKPFELFEVPSKRTSVERAWMSIPGRVKYIENINEFTDRAIFDCLPRATVELGSELSFPRNNVEKCGNIISVSHSREAAIMTCEDAVSNVFISLEENNKKTDDFLNYVYEKDEENFPPSAFTDKKNLTKEQISQLEGEIPENVPVLKFLPDFLKTEEFSNLKDWNFNTIYQTLEKFDILRRKHPKLPVKEFFLAVLRGGLQAAVYISDSFEAGKK